MNFRRLIFILFAAIGLMLPTNVSAVEATSHCTLENVDQNNDRPQWSDLGMDHVLAVNGQSSITPPSPVRLASQGRRLANGNNHSAGDSPEMALQMARHWRQTQCAARYRTLWTKGYIYIIQCLRL